MIPNNIQKTHLLQAIEEIDRGGIPARQQSTRFDLQYEGRQYPPKLVVRVANQLVNGEELWDFGGGKETNDFLRTQGFEIISKESFLAEGQALAIEYNEWALQQLLQYRKTHPDFYFHTRTNKKKELLEAGYWFPGTSYVHIGLTTTASGDQATKSVGVNIDCFPPDHPKVYFIILFKNENRPEVLAFYHALFESLKPFGMRKENHDYFLLAYDEDIPTAMRLFLERDLPIFQILLKEHGLEQTIGISQNSFTKKLNNMLAVRGGDVMRETRLARLCWNTNGWVMPSGSSGKSRFADSFEHTYGFGFEEWLLDLDKIQDDGYHYGFLQPVNQQWQAYLGHKYDIRLYTRDSESKQRYWVGELTSVEVIDKAKADAIEVEYQDKGWLAAMGKQLVNIRLDPRYLAKDRPEVVGALFNVRFLPENVHVYQEQIPFSEQDSMEMGSNRYPFIKSASSLSTRIPVSGAFHFKASAPPAVMSKSIVRRFECREVEHPNLHAKIQHGLYEWLKNQYVENQISSEQFTGSGGSRIDLAVQTDADTYTFYEIKTYNSLMTCIRVVMGQLMEYCYFPDKCLANRLVIVSDRKPEEAPMRYLENIRQVTGLPVYYAYFNINTGELVV